MADTFSVKITSFNVLGLGYCGLPGPQEQSSRLPDLLTKLLQRRDPAENEISLVGLQEDVFLLRNGETWVDHTTASTHRSFERISFLDKEFRERGFEMIAFSVHDGMSNSSQMVIKQEGQLQALADPRHRGHFDESGFKSTRSNLVKLGNSIWAKKGPGVHHLTLRGLTSTFDTWEEGCRLRIPEYSMIPSRSAASAIVSCAGKDVFAAVTCHLAGGKFDDRWLLTGDNLTDISTKMLEKFVSDAGDVPTVAFGDTNMKHFEMVDSGHYDRSIRAMLFGVQDEEQIEKLSPAYEAHRQYLRREGPGDKVTDAEIVSLQQAGKDPAQLASVYDIGPSRSNQREAISTLFRRTKELWRLPALPGMSLIKPTSDASCLFGGVVDHIMFRGLRLRPGSYLVHEDPEAMLPAGTPGIRQIGDRIKVSDHFPVFADFDVLAEPLNGVDSADTAGYAIPSQL